MVMLMHNVLGVDEQHAEIKAFGENPLKYGYLGYRKKIATGLDWFVKALAQMMAEELTLERVSSYTVRFFRRTWRLIENRIVSLSDFFKYYVRSNCSKL